MASFDIPELRTARLTLRAFGPHDLDAYAAICADEEVMRYIGSGGVIDRDMAWRHLSSFLGQWPLRGYGTWAVERTSDGVLVGRVGFLDPPGWPGNEMAWTLARSAWGQGYAFEASRAAIDYGRAHLGVGALISLIRENNQRSIALAERLGATNEGPIEFLGSQALKFLHADA